MTALPRRLQITKNGIGDRSPKMRSVIALVHVVTSDQRSLLSMSSQLHIVFDSYMMAQPGV